MKWAYILQRRLLSGAQIRRTILPQSGELCGQPQWLERGPNKQTKSHPGNANGFSILSPGNSSLVADNFNHVSIATELNISHCTYTDQWTINLLTVNLWDNVNTSDETAYKASAHYRWFSCCNCPLVVAWLMECSYCFTTFIRYEYWTIFSFFYS